MTISRAKGLIYRNAQNEQCNNRSLFVSNWLTDQLSSYLYLRIYSLTCLLTYLQSRVLVEKPRVPQLVRNFPHTMEPDGLLPCSQEPNISPYPEPDKSSLCSPPSPQYYVEDPVFSHLCLGPQSGLFPSHYPVCTSPFPHMCHMPVHFILLDLINWIWRWVQIMKLLIM